MPGFTNTKCLKAEWVKRVYEESKRNQTTARALHYFALGRQDFDANPHDAIRDACKAAFKRGTHIVCCKCFKHLFKISEVHIPTNGCGTYCKNRFKKVS